MTRSGGKYSQQENFGFRASPGFEPPSWGAMIDLREARADGLHIGKGDKRHVPENKSPAFDLLHPAAADSPLDRREGHAAAAASRAENALDRHHLPGLAREPHARRRRRASAQVARPRGSETA